jgi:transcriptional regulator with XRE-family HTH domain
MEMLVAARKAIGLTQEQLAKKIGEKQNFVSKYECGERRLDFLEIVVISRPIEFDMENAVRDIEAKYGPIDNPKKRRPSRNRR